MFARIAFRLAVACCAAASTASLRAADPTPADARIVVDWNDPKDFADTRSTPSSVVIKPQEWLRDLARHLGRRAERAVPAEQRLHVTITDIQRAGTYEPWRGPRWNDVRVIKDIYPPRIDLHFSVTDASGATVAEGDRSLRDNAFLARSTPDNQDPLRYEKRLLDDWLRKEFPTPAGRR